MFVIERGDNLGICGCMLVAIIGCNNRREIFVKKTLLFSALVINIHNTAHLCFVIIILYTWMSTPDLGRLEMLRQNLDDSLQTIKTILLTDWLAGPFFKPVNGIIGSDDS